MDVAHERHSVETVTSPCEKMGIQRLHANTNAPARKLGIREDLKVVASLTALACTNAHEQSRCYGYGAREHLTSDLDKADKVV